MKVTSADIQFLIGCTRREAERIIIDAIYNCKIEMCDFFNRNVHKNAV